MKVSASHYSKYSWMTFIIILVAFFVRFFWLQKVPPSPYWEEVAIGYDAYSILQTGKDHHGDSWPIVAFESFGDWKPSLYFYAVVPFIKIFGLNTLAIRLPSVIAGTVMVWFVGLLSLEFSKEIWPTITEEKRKKNQIFTLLIATFSPWGVIFSRGAWEANLASCLIVIGIWSGYKSWKLAQGKNLSLQFTKVSFEFFFLSVLLLCFAMYTYHSARITAPIIGILIVLPFLRQLRHNAKYFLIVLLLSLALVFPLLQAIGSITISQRFKETSIFSDISVIEESNRLIAQDGNTHWAKLIHHRYFLFAKIIIGNALSHFDPSFLFLRGDINPRHSVQYFGQLLHVSAGLLFLAFVVVCRRLPFRVGMLLSGWLIAGMLPASITLAVPHALRILSVASVFFLFAGWGWFVLYIYFKKRKLHLLHFSFIVLFLIEVAVFFYHYFTVYPKQYAHEWQYGYEQTIQAVEQNKQVGERIFITRKYGRPAMYYWFYLKTDPKIVQAQNSVVRKDQGEFLEFQNITFGDEFTQNDKGLFATTLATYEVLGGEKLSEVQDLNGEIIWVIYRRI